MREEYNFSNARKNPYIKKEKHILINEIRNKIDIVDIVSNYVPLTQKGKNYFGVCPFHNDTNPSMSVSREKQIYKCFSCECGILFNFSFTHT